MDSFNKLITNINTYILNPAIVLLFAIALLVFLYGVFEFVKDSDDAEARATGGRHILWGIIGIMIMFSAFAIIKAVLNTFGIDASPINAVIK